jgi:flavin-dependent dehydrogenase
LRGERGSCINRIEAAAAGEDMPQIAIVGSGPAGYYTAEAALKQWGDAAQVDVFDRLPVPYGLIRSGVAPDHQSIKAVARRFEATALNERTFASSAMSRSAGTSRSRS